MARYWVVNFVYLDANGIIERRGTMSFRQGHFGHDTADDVRASFSPRYRVFSVHELELRFDG